MIEKELKETVETLTNEFRKSIPKNETELSNQFENLMKFLIDGFKERGKSLNEIKKYISAYAEHLMGLDLESKRKEIIYDDSFEKIRQKSVEIFEIAKAKLEGEETKTINMGISDIENELNVLQQSTQKWNFEQAKKLISEAILDAQFIENPKTQALSLRLGHEVMRINRNKNAQESEEEK